MRIPFRPQTPQKRAKSKMGKGHYENLPEVQQLFPRDTQAEDLSDMSIYELANYYRKRIGVSYKELTDLCGFNHWNKSLPEDRSIDLVCRRLFLNKEEENDFRQVAEKEKQSRLRSRHRGKKGKSSRKRRHK